MLRPSLTAVYNLIDVLWPPSVPALEVSIHTEELETQLEVRFEPPTRDHARSHSVARSRFQGHRPEMFPDGVA